MLNEILNIYDSGLRDGQQSLTQTEAIHKICEKINLLINHFNLLEYNTNEAIKDFSDKVEYYLNNGMIEEVSDKLDEFSQDGTLDRIINEQIFDDINNSINQIKSDLVDFRKIYNDNKNNTDNIIGENTKSIDENSIKIKNNADEISKINTWVKNVEDKVGVIQNDYTSVETIYPSNGGVIKKFVLVDDKMGKIRKKYIDCQVTAQQWKEAWENISAGTNNNNGSIWVPFYWSINKSKVIDTTFTIKDLNKWVWQNLGHSKIGVYGLGYLNENGCYVYIENKDPSESTIGVNFSICITETY